MATRYSIEVTYDLQVVGYDPEGADMDHPRGEIVGEVYYLRATSPRGDRRAFGNSFRSYEAAEAYLPLAPSVELWAEVEPEYGSLAYQDYGQELELEREARGNDAEAWGFDTRFGAY
jgi:hypothetical protein